MRLNFNRSVAILIALLMVFAIPSVTDAAKSRKMTLGVSQSQDRSIAAVDDYKASIGSYPAIWGVWSDWGGPDKDFPTDLMNQLRQRDIVPMVTWEPVDPSAQSDCAHWALQNIINGDHDAYIRQWAQDAKNFGGRVILRFAHEMNGYWFIWGYSRCTNTPAKFKAAWRHVWQIFHDVGATNVKFMWSILGTRKLKSHYPGNAYVDYLGLTAFAWGPPKRTWISMTGALGPGMSALYRLAKKPIIVSETGAAYVPSCGKCDKVSWIRDGYPAAYKKWARLKAVVYFDLDMRFVDQPNWLLTAPSGALGAYKSIVDDSRFQGRLP